ncbi:YebC/PmpR family DNA-binding transcriptional regulator [Streptobacillus felis]|uniref:Probable transcriptional regulatory protein HP397_00475 n=1 Tax=Streptobacillus felis TaxID=1384509 RepID=A0A7Z0PEZ0_9FUSO|nr:YebC/PmpR family DNA-binding transcriptional regulator [Streptobacillus felis]NYV27302.1 YebC/PmpR family DNA-binding transcriptional regulator [Streptobacillus felis]
MAGHSKWANIQHRKGRQDKIRGKLFTRLGKEITVAARIGGGNPDFNPRLRLAIDKAKAANVSKDVIDKAIKKGTGELEGVEYIEIRYEGYGASGVAFIVDVVTDNKNRSAGSVRMNFSRNEGNLGSDGSVSFMFDRRGILIFNKDISFEKLLENSILVGALDVIEKENEYIVLTEDKDMEYVLNKLKDLGFIPIESETGMYPQNEIEINDIEVAKSIMNLYEALEDNEDVQNIYSNFNIPNNILEKLN